MMNSEKSIHELQSLLQTIAKIYSSIISNVVHDRISAYHSDAGNADDIGAALHDYIVHIKHSTNHSSPASTATNHVEPDIAAHHLPQADMPTDNDHGLANPLSQYLKKNGLDAELALPIGHKLSASAWDHTHSAIRFAHDGDYANAKLHADLANNAIHELGHYLPAPEFTRFKQAVKAELLTKTG